MQSSYTTNEALAKVKARIPIHLRPLVPSLDQDDSLEQLMLQTKRRQVKLLSTVGKMSDDEVICFAGRDLMKANYELNSRTIKCLTEYLNSS